MPDWAASAATILIGGAAATQVWRFLGVVYASRIDTTSPGFEWVRAMATALIAALIMRMVIAPPGALAETALASRVVALVAAVLSFRFGGKTIFAGVGGAYATFLLMEFAMRTSAPFH